jgi:hypothetical protein
MLLSKLRAGAMGAAGLGIPDKETQGAWIVATAAQSEGAKNWTLTRNKPLLIASIVRDVPPRKKDDQAPLYRLTLTCNTVNRQGDLQLTWSPAPQTNRTFAVSVDGNAGIPHKLEGREERMGNGTAASTGLASARMNVPLPATTLTVSDLFPGETVVFPISDLDSSARREFAACFQGR